MSLNFLCFAFPSHETETQKHKYMSSPRKSRTSTVNSRHIYGNIVPKYWNNFYSQLLSHRALNLISHKLIISDMKIVLEMLSGENLFSLFVFYALFIIMQRILSGGIAFRQFRLLNGERFE